MATRFQGDTDLIIKPREQGSSNAVALRDNMLTLRSNLQHMGGLLDGASGTCADFLAYYGALITIPTYEGIPGEWQGVYNDYLYAADHGITTNEHINILCKDGGVLSTLNYGIARTGINESIDRLSPAIDAANTLLGQ